MLKTLFFLKQKLVKAVNNLVEKDELVAWSRIKEEHREYTITKLLHTVEESALTLANNYKTPTELEIKATEMGKIIINAEGSYRHSNYIKLSCLLFPPVCRGEVLDNCHFDIFNSFICPTFFLLSQPQTWKSSPLMLVIWKPNCLLPWQEITYI